MYAILALAPLPNALLSVMIRKPDVLMPVPPVAVIDVIGPVPIFRLTQPA